MVVLKKERQILTGREKEKNRQRIMDNVRDRGKESLPNSWQRESQETLFMSPLLVKLNSSFTSTVEISSVE